MKKHPAAVLLALFCCIFGLTAGNAEQKISNEGAQIDITLRADGSAKINEFWKYYYEGDTVTQSGRQYPADGYSMTDVAVWLDDVPLTMLDAPDSSHPAGYAAAYQAEDGFHIDIYQDSSNIGREIIISYVVSDAVILHDDIAEFRWRLTSEREECDLKSLNSSVFLPKAVDEEQQPFHLWVHGPDGSDFRKIGSRECWLSSTQVSAGQEVSIRMLMPLSIFPRAARHEAGKAYDTILSEEALTSARQEQNTVRLAAADKIEVVLSELTPFLFLLAALALVGWLAAFFCFPLFIRRRRSGPVSGNRDLTGTCSYTLAASLFCSGFPSGVSQPALLSCAMLRLVLLGYLRLQPDPDSPRQFLLRVEKPSSLSGQPTPYEKAVLSFLESCWAELKQSSGKDWVRFRDLQGKMCSSPRLPDFLRACTRELEREKEPFYLPSQPKDSSGTPPVFLAAAWLPVLFFLGVDAVLLSLSHNFGFGLLCAFAWAAFIFFVQRICGILRADSPRLSPQGEKILRECDSFLHYMETFPSEERPDFAIWQSDFIYLTALCSPSKKKARSGISEKYWIEKEEFHQQTLDWTAYDRIFFHLATSLLSVVGIKGFS